MYLELICAYMLSSLVLGCVIA
ncbi:hypothetical protein OIU76_000692, partial [Salix suchowensis]